MMFLEACRYRYAFFYCITVPVTADRGCVACLTVWHITTYSRLILPKGRNDLFQGSIQNKARITALAALEQKRLLFAQEVQSLGLGRTLLVEHEGGFVGITMDVNGLKYALSGPAPGSEDVFTLKPIENCRARIESRFEEAEGADGFMGMGKKGGEVLRLIFFEGQQDRLTLELMPDVTCYLFTPDCPLTNQNRHRNNSNIVWDFRPQSRENCMSALTYWA